MPNLSLQDTQALDSVKERAKIKIERDLGQDLLAALADPKTVEIMLNADGRLWQERLGEKMRQIGTITTSRAEAIIKCNGLQKPDTFLGSLPIKCTFKFQRRLIA